MCVDYNELIYQVGRIIGDANLFMSECLPNFISRYKQGFIDRGKIMIVPYEVMVELEDKFNSNDITTHISAARGLSAIKDNPEMFCIEQNSMFRPNLNTFGDHYIYAMLVAEMQTYTQMLITADVDLSKDSFLLNSLQSQKYKKKVYVCCANRNGELKANHAIRELISTKTKNSKSEILQKTKTIYIESPSSWSKKIKAFLGGTFIGGFATLTIVYRKDIIKFIQTAF